MRILMFSINPLFPDKVNGGSPRQLQVVAEYLGELGHQVRILCTRHPDNGFRFEWAQGVEVWPELLFRQPFPEPYGITGYRMAYNFQWVADQLEWAERFYIHDGELLFPQLYGRVPTVISFRDNSYAESILGSFLFQGDRLIAISDYSRNVLLATAGRFFPGLAERAVRIDNGVDHEQFRPTPASAELIRLLGLAPASHTLVLHPHRPELAKGIDQTLEVARLLVERYRVANLKVLVPRWFDADLGDSIAASYANLLELADSMGISQHIHLHPWVPRHLMAEYYSLGALSLVLGNCPEAFGNTPYESLSCGTPAIAARVSTYRYLLADEHLYKVDYGDAQGAAEMAAGIIREHRRCTPETLRLVRDRLSVDRQRQAYAEVILGAQKQPPLRYRHLALTVDTPYGLAPWCYRAGHQRFFHDFKGSYHQLPELADLLDVAPIVSRRRALRQGVLEASFDHWYADGWLVPLADDAGPGY